MSVDDCEVLGSEGKLELDLVKIIEPEVAIVEENIEPDDSAVTDTLEVETCDTGSIDEGVVVDDTDKDEEVDPG